MKATLRVCPVANPTPEPAIAPSVTSFAVHPTTEMLAHARASREVVELGDPQPREPPQPLPLPLRPPPS